MKFAFFVLAVLEGISVTYTDNTTVSPATTTASAAATGTAASTVTVASHNQTTATTSGPKRTTSQTTATPCEDDPNTNCAKLKSKCSDHRYDDLLNNHCRKTCGRCDTLTTIAGCFDASNQCKEWNTNGFCNSTFYDEPFKKQYCAKTCGLC
uniref:ShKT domain-containing protein n=1 Tax=Haemonchus contortus TaxID=6289 RepID=A0A7I4YGF9_HAECO